MSLRLNKVANIPEALPFNNSTGYCHYSVGNPNPFIHPTDDVVWPFAVDDFKNQKFCAYNVPRLSDSAAVVNYQGEGGGTFRSQKGDYFCAGYNLDQLFDDDRAATTPMLLGITSSMWSIVGATAKIPTVLPMIIWTNDGAGSAVTSSKVNAYCVLSPTFESRAVAGYTAFVSNIEQTIAVARNGYSHVYFAWYIGRSNPVDKNGAYALIEVGTAVSVTSLKGNRPVFDPVMV